MMQLTVQADSDQPADENNSTVTEENTPVIKSSQHEDTPKDIDYISIAEIDSLVISSCQNRW